MLFKKFLMLLINDDYDNYFLSIVKYSNNKIYSGFYNLFLNFEMIIFCLATTRIS